MVNYQLGKVYKIVDNTNGNIYIGSTCKPYLSSRLAEHKNNYKCFLNGKYHNVTSFKILENGNYDIVLIEECKCDNKMQLHSRERHYIDLLDCVNLHIPLRTKIEYRIENRDAINERKKDYNNINKEKIRENKRLKYLENKDVICEKRSEYRNANKDAINAKKREQYKLKKENNLMV